MLLQFETPSFNMLCSAQLEDEDESSCENENEDEKLQEDNRGGCINTHVRSILHMKHGIDRTIQLLEMCLDLNRRMWKDPKKDKKAEELYNKYGPLRRRSREDVSYRLKHWSTFHFGPNVYSSINSGSMHGTSREAKILFCETNAYVISASYRYKHNN